METKIRIARTPHGGDMGGLSLTARLKPWQFQDEYMTFGLSSTEPGTVRRNHDHPRRR